MDEQTAVKRVLAEYEKLVQSSPRIQALEKKLADGTITMKEGAELNDLRAKAFGRALSGSVPGIERGSREGACVGLLKDRCADVDELALAAQKTALTRQGLNLTPPTAPFEEERARKIGHSLEDDTVPDETIQRRARSATETMLRSQYDRDMKQGAKTCSDAGLRTYIVRDADPGCCKWCSEAAGRYTYGEEPKDVYRRHDNCTCTVTYESGRGRQNVWSKQNWSKEQEQKYLELRDELKAKKRTEAPNVKKPVRLSEKDVQAIMAKVSSPFSREKSVEVEGGYKESKVISEDTKVGIEKAIDKILNEYNVKVGKYVYEDISEKFGRVPFQFVPIDNNGKYQSKFVINSGFNWEENLDKMNERIYNRNYERGLLASKNIEDLIYHEMAHFMCFQECDDYYDFISLERQLRREYRAGVSGYSDMKEDGNETIAEGFVRIKNGETVSEDVKQLVKVYVERWCK